MNITITLPMEVTVARGPAPPSRAANSSTLRTHAHQFPQGDTMYLSNSMIQQRLASECGLVRVECSACA